jgi:hypothetical protein
MKLKVNAMTYTQASACGCTKGTENRCGIQYRQG